MLAGAAATAAQEAASRKASNRENLEESDEGQSDAALAQAMAHYQQQYSHPINSIEENNYQHEAELGMSDENLYQDGNMDIDMQLQMQQQMMEAESRQHFADQSQGQQLDFSSPGMGDIDAAEQRPQEHFLTISMDGIILGATETVTGFLPSGLLMTSAYDSVHPQDMVGLRAVAKNFWDVGRPDVLAYLRRQNVEGAWMWLCAQIVSYIDQPVPGVVIREKVVENVETAATYSRIIRVSALLSTSVEAAKLVKESAERSKNEQRNFSSHDAAQTTNTMSKEDAAALSRLLGNGSISSSSAGASDKKNKCQSYIVTSGVLEDGRVDEARNSTLSDPSDPSYAIMEKIKSGVCLDMSKAALNEIELKMITLVLTGKVLKEELWLLVVKLMESPETDFNVMLDLFVLEKEKEYFQHHSRGNNAASSDFHGKGFNSSSFRTQHDSFNLPRRHSKQTLPTPSVLTPALPLSCPPPLSVVNLSYTSMGNIGMELISEILYVDSPFLKSLDVGFCSIDERGLLALCRALQLRKKKGLPQLQGLILSGNVITYKVAKELGLALNPHLQIDAKKKKRVINRKRMDRTLDATGYTEDDDEWDMDDDADETLFGASDTGFDGSFHDKTPALLSKNCSSEQSHAQSGVGLVLLHVACTSLRYDSLFQLLLGLGQDCPIGELSISSNKIGSKGAQLFVDFLEGKGIPKYDKKKPVMSNLDRLDFSNNKLGNDGTAKLTRAISKRVKGVNIVDLRLSSNEIGPLGIETIMNKLLQHKLMRLSLDNNCIGDRGCQLVAATLPSMHHLSRLSLSFNQIGSRGITTLMRALIGCESIVNLGLSGNIIKISGAIAMGFTLSQHPRLADLEMDNCCLSQVAQCHIAAGVISNRWVPMRVLNGFSVGPPMVAIGALDVMAQNLSNEECFRIRRDIQMKTILQWMEGGQQDGSEMKDPNETPSQSAYLRMLDWLSRIPFDEDELDDLRAYFYDIDGGDNERGSDGNLNLRHRGDLLAALGSQIVDEIRDEPVVSLPETGSFIGLSIDDDDDDEENDLSTNGFLNSTERFGRGEENDQNSSNDNEKQSRDRSGSTISTTSAHAYSEKKKRRLPSESLEASISSKDGLSEKSTSNNIRGRAISADTRSTMSTVSRVDSVTSSDENDRPDRSSGPRARISMFPPFAAKLEMLKAHAQDLMDHEHDPNQQDIVAQQFAEASLTLLRQLRYHCMNSGLDGWRQGKLRRKVLIVDDSIVTRKMVSRAFEKANFIVDTAENGKEGVEKLKQSIYDIAFMDIDMPIMNGFDATKTLRDWEDIKRPGARQPICALTAAYVDDFERSELMKFKEAGLDVMESKPCNIPRLFKVVDDVSPMFSDLSISVSHLETSSA